MHLKGCALPTAQLLSFSNHKPTDQTAHLLVRSSIHSSTLLITYVCTHARLRLSRGAIGPGPFPPAACPRLPEDHEPDVHLASSPLSPMHSLSCLSHRRATATYTNAPIFIGIRPGSARHWQEAAVRRVRTWERRAQEEERQDIHLRVFVWGRSGRVEDTMRQIG